MIICVLEEDIKGVLTECFSSDMDLINKWHVSEDKTVEGCVNRTVTDLMDASNYMFYKLQSDDELIGFYGTEKADEVGFLTGFFIKPEFRTKEVKKYLWNSIRLKFNNGPFLSAVYSKNERAKRFLEKQGGELIPLEEKDFSLYKFN